jgi:hypothetical protein
LTWSTTSEPSFESSILTVEQDNQLSLEIKENENFKITQNKYSYFELVFFLENIFLNQEENIMFEMDPFYILFSQRTIKNVFGNGGSLELLIDDLVDGLITPDQIEPIRICVIDDYIFSADNRRLYAYQEAIKKGASFSKIPVTLVDRDDPYTFIYDKLENAKYIENGLEKYNRDFTKIHEVTWKSHPGYYDVVN